MATGKINIFKNLINTDTMNIFQYNTNTGTHYYISENTLMVFNTYNSNYLYILVPLNIFCTKLLYFSVNKYKLYLSFFFMQRGHNFVVLLLCIKLHLLK